MEFTIANLLVISAPRENSDDPYERGIAAGLRIAAEAMQAKLDYLKTARA